MQLICRSGSGGTEFVKKPTKTLADVTPPPVHLCSEPLDNEVQAFTAWTGTLPTQEQAHVRDVPLNTWLRYALKSNPGRASYLTIHMLSECGGSVPGNVHMHAELRVHRHDTGEVICHVAARTDELTLYPYTHEHPEHGPSAEMVEMQRRLIVEVREKERESGVAAKEDGEDGSGGDQLASPVVSPMAQPIMSLRESFKALMRGLLRGSLDRDETVLIPEPVPEPPPVAAEVKVAEVALPSPPFSVTSMGTGRGRPMSGLRRNDH